MITTIIASLPTLSQRMPTAGRYAEEAELTSIAFVAQAQAPARVPPTRIWACHLRSIEAAHATAYKTHPPASGRALHRFDGEGGRVKPARVRLPHEGVRT
jgi:hypothetical protein